jgi:hypothetical protein
MGVDKAGWIDRGASLKTKRVLHWGGGNCYLQEILFIRKLKSEERSGFALSNQSHGNQLNLRQADSVNPFTSLEPLWSNYLLPHKVATTATLGTKLLAREPLEDKPYLNHSILCM